MEINNNMKVGGINSVVTPKRSSAAATSTNISADPFASSTALESALHSLPDVRPDAVDRAKQLISDPGYPSADTVKKLSDFFADKFSSSAE